MVRVKLTRSIATAALAATSIAGWAAAQSALGSAITYSHLNVDNFLIDVTPLNGATFTLLGAPTNQADISAALGAANDSDAGTSSTIPLDVPRVCLGPGCAAIGENDFTQHVGGEFSRADSLLDAPTTSGTAQSQQVSETNLLNTPNGSATTRNGLIASFQFELTGPSTDGGTLDISFDASRDMFVELGQPLPNTGTVSASTAFQITIRDPASNVLVSWASNGNLNAGDVIGSVGGTEHADPFNLNDSISRVNSIIPSSVSNALAFFHIETDALPTNTVLDFSLFSRADTSAVQQLAVTEPIGPASIGAVLLFASMWLRRRRPQA
jgi:hypothetical protein